MGVISCSVKRVLDAGNAFRHSIGLSTEMYSQKYSTLKFDKKSHSGDKDTSVGYSNKRTSHYTNNPDVIEFL
jgi:hypothetical protein